MPPLADPTVGYPWQQAANAPRFRPALAWESLDGHATPNDAKGDGMYIGGGVLALIIIILLLIWLF